MPAGVAVVFAMRRARRMRAAGGRGQPLTTIPEGETMDTRTHFFQPEIEEILNSPDKARLLREAFEDMHPYDMFVLCDDLEDRQIAECVRILGIPTGISLFERFEDERKKTIFSCFNKEWMADILEEMPPDERADFVKCLPGDKVEEILPLVARAERLDIKKLLTYQEGTAGSIMTTEYASLPRDVTVRAALEKIKLQAFNRETIYYIYVIDHDRKLLGFVSLKDILVEVSTLTVADIMQTNLVTVGVNEDKEQVAKMLSDYDFLAIPVVDDRQRLVGIVTVDDVLDVVEEETTEDIYKYGAAGEYSDYRTSAPYQVARQRSFWLMILICVGFVSAFVLAVNSEHLHAVMALSFFTPMLLGASGNAGTQSSTVVVRGLATGSIGIKDYFFVLRREVSVGMMEGVVMALLGAVMAVLVGKDPRIGLTVGCSMILTVTLATSLGATLPILFKRLGLDPALMSGPFITSIVDVVSLLVYFRIAMVFFHL